MIILLIHARKKNDQQIPVLVWTKWILMNLIRKGTNQDN